MKTLAFRNTVLETISRNDQICFTSSELARALEYASSNAITKLYNQNSDEFAHGMTDIVEVPNMGTSGNLKARIRIFSLRGAHLIAMFARTPVAKEFRKWVLDILDKEVGNPQYKPEAPELFSHSDTRNLARLIWCISSGFRLERPWSNAVWFALRDVTGTPSPERFEVRHIPLIAQECRRIYHIASQLRGITCEAEKQTIKRLLRKREDADSVLAEMKQLFSERLHHQRGAVARQLEYWHEGEVMKFLSRGHS